MLAAVGETTRMLILHRLIESPRYVGELAEIIGIPMVNMSHHLGVMRQAGLLTDRKKGRQIVYQCNPEIFTAGGDNPNVIATFLLGSYRMSILREEDSTKPKAKNSK